MMTITPKPPYYAVIFTSIRNENDEGYQAINDQLLVEAKKYEGFIGIDSARNEIGISVSYWKDIESIKERNLNALHASAKKKARGLLYSALNVRMCKVEQEY